MLGNVTQLIHVRGNLVSYARYLFLSAYLTPIYIYNNCVKWNVVKLQEDGAADIPYISIGRKINSGWFIATHV